MGIFSGGLSRGIRLHVFQRVAEGIRRIAGHRYVPVCFHDHVTDVVGIAQVRESMGTTPLPKGDGLFALSLGRRLLPAGKLVNFGQEFLIGNSALTSSPKMIQITTLNVTTIDYTFG